MRGYYNIYQDGELVRVAENNITDGGRRVLLRYLAGHVGRFAGAIAVGTSSVLPSRVDTSLGFEFGRAAVNLSTPDFINDQLIFKASMDPALSGYIHELGIFPFLTEPATDFNSRLLTGFDLNLETFAGDMTVNTSNFRIGNSSVQLISPVSTSTGITQSNMLRDFSGFGADDTFSLAYFMNDANVTRLQVRMGTDSTNYWKYDILSPGPLGYNVATFNKGEMVAVGTPDWSNITQMVYYIISNAGGAATVQFDGLRVNDTTDYADYALISRAVVAIPFYKTAGKQLDVEYVLEFRA